LRRPRWLGFFGGLDTAPAGGAIEQQFGDQALAAVLAGQALRLLVGDQPLQGGRAFSSSRARLS
jgi:hypothetical protein